MPEYSAWIFCCSIRAVLASRREFPYWISILYLLLMLSALLFLFVFQRRLGYTFYVHDGLPSGLPTNNTNGKLLPLLVLHFPPLPFLSYLFTIFQSFIYNVNDYCICHSWSYSRDVHHLKWFGISSTSTLLRPFSQPRKKVLIYPTIVQGIRKRCGEGTMHVIILPIGTMERLKR